LIRDKQDEADSELDDMQDDDLKSKSDNLKVAEEEADKNAERKAKLGVKEVAKPKRKRKEITKN